jgi:hypothetical protein
MSLLFDHHSIPLRKQHEGPQTVRMIAAAAHVGVEHAVDGGDIEKFFDTSWLLHQKLPRQRRQRAPQPGAQG